MQHFQAPATIQGISTLRDKTLKVTAYISMELPGEDKAKLFDLEQKEGWLMFSENPFQEKDIPQEPAKVEKDEKSLSQRLYNVLYVYWQQNYNPTAVPFNQWREGEMNRLIEAYKSKLR